MATDFDFEHDALDEATKKKLIRRIKEAQGGNLVEKSTKSDWIPINISMIVLGFILIWSLL